MYGYADDVEIIVSGESINVISESVVGKYNVTLPEPLKFRGVEIEYGTTMNYLGVYMGTNFTENNRLNTVVDN